MLPLSLGEPIMKQHCGWNPKVEAINPLESRRGSQLLCQLPTFLHMPPYAAANAVRKVLAHGNARYHCRSALPREPTPYLRNILSMVLTGISSIVQATFLHQLMKGYWAHGELQFPHFLHDSRPSPLNPTNTPSPNTPSHQHQTTCPRGPQTPNPKSSGNPRV